MNLDRITDIGIKNRLISFFEKERMLKDREKIPLIISFIGGTGVGKSSILNLIAGIEISRTSAVRPTTSKPVVFYPRNFPFTPSSLGLQTITFESHSFSPDAGIEHLNILFFDLPDIDSVRKEHGKIAETVIESSDVVFFVVSPDKYGDSILYEFLSKTTELNKKILVILNKADLLGEEELKITQDTLMNSSHFGRYQDSFQFMTLSTRSLISVHRNRILTLLSDLADKKSKIRNVELLKEKKILQEKLFEYGTQLDSSLKQLEDNRNGMFQVEFDSAIKLTGISAQAYEHIKPLYYTLLLHLYPFSPLSPVNLINRFTRFVFSRFAQFLKAVFSFFTRILIFFRITPARPSDESAGLITPDFTNSTDSVNSVINQIRKKLIEVFDLTKYINSMYDFFSTIDRMESAKSIDRFNYDHYSNQVRFNINSFFETFYVKSRTLRKKLHRFDFVVTVFDWLFILFSILMYSSVKMKVTALFLFKIIFSEFLPLYVVFVYLFLNFIKKLSLDLILESSFDAGSEEFSNHMLSEFTKLKEDFKESMNIKIASVKEEKDCVRSCIKRI